MVFKIAALLSKASPTTTGVTSNEVLSGVEEVETETVAVLKEVEVQTNTPEAETVPTHVEPVTPGPAWLRDERPSHPCQRPCVVGQAPRTCHYHFAVQWYYAMSKACHHCAHNVTDCYRPECIPANGVKRTIITVNKLLPGPSVEVRFTSSKTVVSKKRIL